MEVLGLEIGFGLLVFGFLLTKPYIFSNAPFIETRPQAKLVHILEVFAALSFTKWERERAFCSSVLLVSVSGRQMIYKYLERYLSWSSQG